MVAIKPLEWTHVPGNDNLFDLWKVDHIFPNTDPYRIIHTPKGFEWHLWGVTAFETCDTLEAAKAAAQADYEQRILSALHPAPEAASAGAAGEVEAMRLAEEIAEARRRLAAWDINALPNDMSLLDIVDARIGDLQKYMNLVDNLPFRHQDIQRGLILFRTSNNAHGLTNFVSLTARVEALPQSAKDELASMMRNIAEGLSPAAPSDTAPSPKGVSDGVRERIKTFLCVRESARADDYPWSQLNDATDILRDINAALSQEPVPATAEERAASKEGA